MMAQHAHALLLSFALFSCTSSATVGRLAGDDADIPDVPGSDASQLDGARTDEVSDAIVDATVEPLVEASVTQDDAGDDAGNGASAPEASVGCTDDRSCPAGRMCSRGACVQCVVDAHCAGQEEPRCDALGRCVECRSTAECPLANQICAPWGECELTCTRDAQCVASLRCDSNFRVCLECVEDVQCSGPGEFCDEGVCARCAGNPDCPN
jgi:hypothetical protein